jgi:hypothetical protein
VCCAFFVEVDGFGLHTATLQDRFVGVKGCDIVNMNTNVRIDKVTINGVEVRGFESITYKADGPWGIWWQLVPPTIGSTWTATYIWVAPDPTDADHPKYTRADRDEENAE